MPKSKKRGGKKAHNNRVTARNQKIKGKQNSFIKQFKERLDAGVAEELEKQAGEVKAKEIDGTEERTVLDTPMSTSPIINTTPSK
jgi:ribosomal protein S20